MILTALPCERQRRRYFSVNPMRLLCAVLFAVGLVALPAAAADFSLEPHQAAIGAVKVHMVRKGENLLDIARAYNLGYVELMAANAGMDPWRPPVGAVVTIPGVYLLPPGPRRGIVVNIAWHRMFYFPPSDSEKVETFPLGISAVGQETPLGTTRIVRKQLNPIWRPPASIRAEHGGMLPVAVQPGPDNPLGSAAFYLGWPRVLIHGTNKPDGVGRTVSHGCLHLYPEDIDALFPTIDVGTQVTVINEEAMVAWVDDSLYVQIYPTKVQGVQIEQTGAIKSRLLSPVLVRRVVEAAEERGAEVNWDIVTRANLARTGIPLVVATASAAD